MKILSISWIGSPSTVALMIDGEIIACVSEERFTRIKNEDSYPRKAIEAVLTMGCIRAREIDLVVMAGERFDPLSVLCHKLSRFSTQDRLREQYQYWYPKLYKKKDVSYLDIFKDKLDLRQYPGDWDRVMDFVNNGQQENAFKFFQDFRRKVVSQHIGVNPKKIIFVHHHLAHGYHSYYGSPMKKDRTVILTADAWGDDMNASVSIAKGGDIRLICSSQNFNLGRIYRYITLLLGMKPDEHEYKVMGLAAYAKPKYYEEALRVFEQTMYVNNLEFSYKEIPSDLYFYFKERLEGQRFDSIAGAIQKYTENILIKWTRNALKATRARKVCFGGGVAMNIKAIMELAKLPEVEDIFICPTPSDESLAIGAAYVVMHDICLSQGLDPAAYLKPLKNTYLGPAVSQSEIKTTIEMTSGKGYSIHENPKLGHIAQLIADGKIIGLCVGRSEFGARALGNRSILADPRRLEVVKVINEKIKSRDFWMPFSPSILEEESDRYLINHKKINSPYMTIAFETKPLARKHLIASLHQADFTARPQIVNKLDNPHFYNLLKEFHSLTGIGGVLNTSFNVHGEPIIQSPEDAFDVFERTKLDVLLLDGYLIERIKTSK